MNPLSFIDVHSHLQDEKFVNDIDTCVENAKNAGVNRIINAASNIEESVQIQKIAEKYDECYAMAGIHPHNASEFDQTGISTLKQLLNKPKVLGIGEIGLDFHYDFSERDVQIEVFKKLWALGAELKLPVVVHIREAYKAFFDSIENMPAPPKVLLHCFSGSLETAKQAEKLGYNFSIGGVLTFPNSKKTAEVFSYLPLERIHLETDCPYLSPQGKRGKRNEPANLPIIAEYLAKLRGISLEELAQKLSGNAKAFFGDKLK